MSDTINRFREEADNGKKWCYDCAYYCSSYFCGYSASSCSIYGSLDIDQQKYHPDITADTCGDYKFKGGKRWFEKYD